MRLIDVDPGSLSYGASQLDLLDATRRAKLEKLARATDKLCERFGFDKVQLGGSLRNNREI